MNGTRRKHGMERARAHARACERIHISHAPAMADSRELGQWDPLYVFYFILESIYISILKHSLAIRVHKTLSFRLNWTDFDIVVNGEW